MGDNRNRILELISNERDRWVLWLPVGIGAGICLYFRLPTEPALWTGPLVFTIGGLAGLAYHRSAHAFTRWLLIVAIVCLTVGAGLTAASLRTFSVAGTVLQKTIHAATLTGRVEKIETFPTGLRLTLTDLRISALQPYRTPARARVRLKGGQPEIWPGDWIRLRAGLSPPSPPTAPGGFDFQRHAFFQEIGAIGFGLGRATVMAVAKDTHGAGKRYLIARLRHHLTGRIISALPGIKGGVAAALMTGEKRAVDEQTVQNLRDSGLAHLLSISGLHVGLVAGIIFAGVRFFLALMPFIGLRHPIKKWAAVAAIVGAFCYALIAGATLPTQRAFLMLGLVLIGVIVDRRGISMRSLAWAAVAVLLVQPESLLGPSFQMSFAAVMALVAVYEGIALRARTRLGKPSELPRWIRTAGLYVVGVGVTTLVAGLATAPYSAFHFNQFADYGLMANLIAVPITALWVMPWAVIAFALMTVGLEPFALNAMSWGVDLVITVAQTVSAWPGSVTLLPTLPDWGLAVLSLGLIWLCLWQRVWRMWGIIPVIAGMSSVYFSEPPDILIDGKARLVALKPDAGELRFSNPVGAKFTREMWLRQAGLRDMRGFKDWPDRSSASLACDMTACLYRAHHQTVAIIHSPAALLEDCWRADAVLSLVPVRRRCPAPIVIDRFDLWQKGTHALWINDDGIKVRTVNEERGDRPWVLKPQRQSPPPAKRRPNQGF